MIRTSGGKSSGIGLKAAMAALMAGFGAAPTAYGLSSEPDTDLNGSGYIMLDYWGDKSPASSGNDALDALVGSDGAVTILGKADVTSQACAGDFCWDVDKTVAVIAFIAADGTVQNVIETDAQFTDYGRFTPDGGKVVVMDNTSPFGGPAGTLKRYHLNGTLDTTFATGGVFTDPGDLLKTNYPGFWFDGEGRLLIASQPLGLVRLTADGAADTTFGTDGATGSAGGDISSVVEATDGAYYVMVDGNISPGASLRRYSSGGVLDAGFGSGGELTLPDATSAAEMLAMPDGGVLVITGSLGNPFQAQLTHYDSSGDVVAQSGLLSETSSTYTSFLALGRGASLRRLDDGKILLAVNWQGTTPQSQTGTFQLFGLFNADLTRVTDFDGDNGLYLAEGVIPAMSNTIPVRNTLDLDGSARIVMAGSSLNESGQPRWVMGRLLGDHDGSALPDTTPDAFSFTPVGDVAPDTAVTSEAVTIGGIEAAATVTVSNGEYAIGCGGSFTSGGGSIDNGQSICVRHTSAAAYETTTTTTLTVGGVSADFVSTTMADPGGMEDTTPDPFSFAAKTDVSESTEVTSDPVTITGLNAAAPVTVSGGSYSIGCDGSFTTGAATIENNDTVCVRHTSAATCLTDTTTLLTIGGVQGGFTSTTTDGGDSDGDGVSDCLDDDPHDAASTTPALPGGNKLGMFTASGNFEAVEVDEADMLVNQAGRPSGYSFPYGLASYKITGLGVGDSVDVTLTYPAVLPAGTRIFKYTDADGFTEFPNAVIAGDTVTLTLVDGGEGDADGTANGEIVDPVGVSTVASSGGGSASSSSGGSGGGGGGTLSPWLAALLLAQLLGITRRRRITPA